MSKNDELILVIPRDSVIDEQWTGINTSKLADFERIVRDKGLFKRRGDMEEDPNWKQVIPYMVFKYKDQFFLMQRGSGGGETRLYNRYSLGIGGHINEADITGKDILEWGKREFEEEVDYQGSFEMQPVGLLNDDTDLVGQVHLGYVILIEGDSANIQIKDEHQSGSLITLGEIKDKYEQMETWSKFVYDRLKESYG